MIHIKNSILTTLLICSKAVGPPGGRHGSYIEVDGKPMGRTGSSANNDGIGRRLSQLYHYFDVCCRRFESLDFQGFGVLHRYNSTCAKTLPPRRCQGSLSNQAARATISCHTSIHKSDETGGKDQSNESGIWFFHMVGGEAGRAFGKGYGYSIQQRSIAKTPAPTRFFNPSAQAYTQGQKKRDSVPRGQERPYWLEKKALKPAAKEALVFQDETEIHLHPILTRIWWLVGQQPEVPSPGKNEKQVVYGGVDYRTGKITYTIAATKSGLNFLAFLVALVVAYAGQKVRLVCDNGRFHQTKAVFRWLETHRDQIEIYWLPPYCPSLNLIERLWGHLKRTVLANVLFATMDDLVAAFRRGVARVNGHRNKMNFIFDHDDIKKKVA